jgi:hypothetical protein
LPGVDTALLEPCYSSSAVWDSLDPKLVTLASPDPQAFHPPEEPVNVLQVSLPTNFRWPASMMTHTPRCWNGLRRTLPRRASGSTVR